MDSVGNDRITHLDGLRGICALIVVFHHFAAAFYPSIIFGELAKRHSFVEWFFYATPLNLLFAGNFAVTTFFVLSGYVLSYTFFKNGKLSFIQSMAIRRYPRLVGPVFFSVLIGYFLIHFGFQFHHLITDVTFSHLWLGKMFLDQGSIWEAIYQGLLGAFIDPHSWRYNHVIWSMYYEFWGSFLVFSFLSLFGKYQKRFVLYFFVSIIFWNSYFLGFILGMMTADLFCSQLINKTSPLFRPRIITLFFLIALLLGSYPMFEVENTFYHYFAFRIFQGNEQMILLHTIGSWFLLLSFLSSKILHRLFSFSIFRFLGKISFSVYLLHPLIIVSFSSLVFYLSHLFFSYHLSVFISFSISFLFILLLSHFYYEFIDQKSMALSRLFVKKFAKRK